MQTRTIVIIVIGILVLSALGFAAYTVSKGTSKDKGSGGEDQCDCTVINRIGDVVCPSGYVLNDKGWCWASQSKIGAPTASSKVPCYGPWSNSHMFQADLGQQCTKCDPIHDQALPTLGGGWGTWKTHDTNEIQMAFTPPMPYSAIKKCH